METQKIKTKIQSIQTKLLPEGEHSSFMSTVIICHLVVLREGIAKL